MITIADTIRYYGLLAPETAAIAISAILLLYAGPPLLLAGGRLAELASYLVGVWMDPRQRNLNRTGDYAHRAHASMSPVLGIEAWPVGLLIFAGPAVAAAGWPGPQPLDVAAGLVVSSGAPRVATLTALGAGVCHLLVAGPLSAGGRSHAAGSAVVAFRVLLMFSAVWLAVETSLDWRALAGVATAYLLIRAPIMIATQGVRLYGLFMPIWLGFALVSWALRVAAIATAAPLIAILPPLLRESPVDRRISAGLARKIALQKQASMVPLCTAIDAVSASGKPS